MALLEPLTRQARYGVQLAGAAWPQFLRPLVLELASHRPIREVLPGVHHGRPGFQISYATSRSFCASARLCSFFSDWFSIWRIRSRVTLNVRPTSSSVRGCSPPSP